MASPDSSATLYSAVIHSIRTYSGEDPLLPWLQGIKKLKTALPPQVLKDKLPRFLQRCISTFQGDSRYRNDLRYLRVWIQLMDYVNHPKQLLRAMEENQIGKKCALFYQAYALYFEKLKNFEESEKVYNLGIQNFAEPAGELQRSHEQFLHRWDRHRARKAKDTKAPRMCATTQNGSCSAKGLETKEYKDALVSNQCNESLKVGTKTSRHSRNVIKERSKHRNDLSSSELKSEVGSCNLGNVKSTTLASDDMIVVKFVGSTIVGKSEEEAEDACHHGLVDPTINMKEARNAINNMFREPLELDIKNRRSSRHSRSQPASNGFKVFIDENLDEGTGTSVQVNAAMGKDPSKSNSHNDFPEPFNIFIDEEEEIDRIGDNLSGQDVEGPSDMKTYRDDTLFCKFVGSTIFEESNVENACHHGLVDPTINMKEAMDDINSMFGKPLDFVKTSKSMNSRKSSKSKDSGDFSIYVDHDAEEQQQKANFCSFGSHCLEHELNEPTILTKEAMNDINEMFGKPLDF